MQRRRLRVQRKAYTRKAHLRRVRVSRDPEEHFRRPLYKQVRVKKTKVPATTFTIKDIGAVGRGKKVIKKIRKGLLKKHGYSTDLPASKRHVALKKADKQYGTIRLFKMLHAQVVLRLRTQPAVAKIFKADRDWVKRNLLSKAEGIKMTAKPRKKWVGMSPRARALAMPERK